MYNPVIPIHTAFARITPQKPSEAKDAVGFDDIDPAGIVERSSFKAGEQEM